MSDKPLRLVQQLHVSNLSICHHQVAGYTRVIVGWWGGQDLVPPPPPITSVYPAYCLVAR